MYTQDCLFKVLSDTPSYHYKSYATDQFLILQTPPEGFIRRKGNFGTCAHHSLKAVIEGKNRKPKPLQEYSCDWRSRLTYLMTPRGIKKTLKRYHLKTRTIQAKNLTYEQKVTLLKEELRKGPLILLIANGLTKKKFFSWRKALTHRHYITLW